MDRRCAFFLPNIPYCTRTSVVLCLSILRQRRHLSSLLPQRVRRLCPVDGLLPRRSVSLFDQFAYFYRFCCPICFCLEGVGKYLGAAAATTLPRPASAMAAQAAASGASTQGQKSGGTGARAAAVGTIDWADPAFDTASSATTARAKGKGKSRGFGDFSGW